MPEKFCFSSLVEGPPSAAVRLSFLDVAREKFDRWLTRPYEVMLLDFLQAAPGSTQPWSNAGELLRRHLSETEILFVYFEAESGTGGTTVVSLREMADKSVFTIALADMEVVKRPQEIAHAMFILFEWATSENRKCMVVAGGEVEIDDAWTDVRHGMLSMTSDSLVEWLCCDRVDLHDAILGFEGVQEQGPAILLRRKI